MLRTRSLVILLALLAALTLSATAGARSAATTVVVTLRNTAFTISPKSVAAGPVRFRIVNRGTRTRSFSVAGKKTVVRARATAFLTVTFRTAGITRFVSTVVGSSSGTLRGTITVRAVVSGPTTKVSVSATEFAFALSMQSVPAGT
ncbi:MAG: hypothetical protein QOD43_1425, partial [Gaiellaceae bacterium]|nr:hypothetical protein [Gaiellaceae bacterium]